MIRSRLAAPLIAAALLSGCAQSAITGPKLSAAEVKAAFVGSTQHAKSVEGDYVAYVAPDGTAKYRGGGTTNPGTWKVTDAGQFCSDWKLNGPEQGCMTVYGKDGTYTLILPNGVVYATATTSSGNTDGL